MRFVLISAALLLLTFVGSRAYSENLPNSSLPVREFPMPDDTDRTNSRNAQEIQSGIEALNGSIGGYPPRYSSEEHRESIYDDWSELLNDAHALRREMGESEITLHLLGELYRQGNNLDVLGSGKLAMETIEKCLETFPTSVPCHLSSSYFYLSINPQYTPRAERSLVFLRDHFTPEVNEEVESGFVFLYLLRRDEQSAKKQIEYYLAQFPDGSNVETFLKFQNALRGGIKDHSD